MNSRAFLIRRWVQHSFSGRALALGVALKLLGLLLRLVTTATLAGFVDTVGEVALAVGAIAVAYQLFTDLKRVVLWRVRRKLTLSYIFIGFIPALLIIAFFLTCALLLFFNVSAYMLRSRLANLVEQTDALAHAAAFELSTAATGPERQRVLDARAAIALAATDTASPGMATLARAGYSLVPSTRVCGGASGMPAAAPEQAGAWLHAPPPESIPEWVPCSGYAGLVAYSAEPGQSGERGAVHLVARAVTWPIGPAGGYALVVDIPLEGDTSRRLRQVTGVELGNIAAIIEPNPNGGSPRVLRGGAAPGASAPRASTAATPPAERTDSPPLWRRSLEWVAFLDVVDWPTGRRGTATMSIRTTIADIYERIFATPAERIGDVSFGQLLLILLAVVGGLFLVIQIVALVMGLALARSITGAVHELFAGTERVRRGDFTKRIAVRSRDQLGELADSFNSMTSSIEDLLLQQEEKERLAQELRIARRIQMSLLPQGPASFTGLSLVAHCEPALEVGGDYYDYLPIDDHRLGLLIADVSGKGTSAALYMAELKGLLLGLSQRYHSPRALLIEANRLMSRQLDTRSFITITYAVIDLQAGTMTYSRAGHCPLIYVPGPYAPDRRAQVLTEGGLVLGLQLDNGEMFERMLTEVTVRLGCGDLILLYTDGISEAMNASGDCFGDNRLGELAQLHAQLPFEELRERILRSVSTFVGPAVQHDDMTMLLVRVEDMEAGRGLIAS